MLGPACGGLHVGCGPGGRGRPCPSAASVAQGSERLQPCRWRRAEKLGRRGVSVRQPCGELPAASPQSRRPQAPYACPPGPAPSSLRWALFHRELHTGSGRAEPAHGKRAAVGDSVQGPCLEAGPGSQQASCLPAL